MVKLIKNAGLFNTQIGKIIVEVVCNVKITNDLKNLHPDLLWLFPKPQNSIKRDLLTFITLNQTHGYLHMIDKISRFSNAVII